MRTRGFSGAVLGVLRGALAAAGCAAGFLLLIGVLALVQAQRDEARPAGAALVLAAEGPPGGEAALRRARLDHALDLYRRGVVTRFILAGGAPAGAETSEAAAGMRYLVEQGVPADAVLTDEQGGTTIEALRAAAAVVRERGIGSVLLVTDPPHALRALKIARDLGLAAYPSPPTSSSSRQSITSDIAYAARESWAYTTYIFAGR